MDSVNIVVGLVAGALIGFVGTIAWDVHRDYRSVLLDAPMLAWLVMMSTAAVGGIIGALV